MGTQNRGLMGGFLGRKETQTVAVRDVDSNRRLAAKSRVEDFYAKQTDGGTYRGCAAFGNSRAMLIRKDIDAVVIATPDRWHAYIAIAAANSGKDIYCEKPLCQSIHEAPARWSRPCASKRIFQVGSMQRSSKEFRIACKLVRNGAIGKVQRVEVQVGGPGKPCDFPTERDNPGSTGTCGSAPPRTRLPFGAQPARCSQTLSQLAQLSRVWRRHGDGLGRASLRHRPVGPRHGSRPTEIFPAEKADAQEGVRLAYANGVEVVHKSGNGVWFFGTDGKLFVDRGKFSFWRGEQQKARETSECDAIAKEYLADAKVRLYESKNHLADFLSSVATRKKPICDVEVGARTVSVCHLVNLAYYHGQKLKWNPKSEKFTGGTGNKAWLDVPHRDPWQVA